MERPEAEETVVLEMQRHIYKLKDALGIHWENLEIARKAVMRAAHEFRHAEEQIIEVAQFLDREAPGALREGEVYIDGFGDLKHGVTALQELEEAK